MSQGYIDDKKGQATAKQIRGSFTLFRMTTAKVFAARGSGRLIVEGVDD
ncbi:hypothetical protein HDF11_000061 [Tunturiibacter psychrotolerans]